MFTSFFFPLAFPSVFLVCVVLFFARVLIAVDIAWPNRLAVFAMYFCLVVCGPRARLSVRHQHGRWLCWMWMGGNISSMRRTHIQVGA